MLKSIKGFNDILQIETDKTRPSSEWRQLEQSLTAVLDQFGFEQIRLPIVEETINQTRPPRSPCAQREPQAPFVPW